nr:hypothetical protein [Tanacetum cinerariifolium]
MILSAFPSRLVLRSRMSLISMILPLVPLVPRLLLRLKLRRSERPLLLMPLRAMLLRVLGLPWLNLLGARVEALLLSLLKVLTPEGKGIMANDAATLSGASRPRPFSRPAPLFRDVFDDAIHADFSPYSAGPYYATHPQDGIAGNCEFTLEEWNAPEMVRVEALFEDQLTANITDSRLKGYEERVAGVAGLELQVSTLKKQVSGLNDKLVSSDAYFAKSKAKGNDRKKKIKSLIKSMDTLHAIVARLSAALNQATVLEAEKDEEILLRATRGEDSASLSCSPGMKLSIFFHTAFKPEKLARPANVSTSKDARVSPPIIKESTVTPASKSLELYTNVDLTPSVVASKHNEDMVKTKVDGSDSRMTDDIVAAKSGQAFVQGISVALEDVVELAVVGLGCASSDPNDVMVALSADEKGDGFFPSSTADEDVVANPSEIMSHATRPRPNGFPLGPCSIAGQASV